MEWIIRIIDVAFSDDPSLMVEVAFWEGLASTMKNNDSTLPTRSERINKDDPTREDKKEL